MKKFSYTIKDVIGLHARPTGMLVKEAQKYQSKIMINKEGKSAEATRVMAIMSLAVKYGETVEVQVYGADEDVAYKAMKRFFEEYL